MTTKTAIKRLNEMAEEHVDENYHTEASMLYTLSKLVEVEAKKGLPFSITPFNALSESVYLWSITP